jgi:hypothetical protein
MKLKHLVTDRSTTEAQRSPVLFRVYVGAIIQDTEISEIFDQSKRDDVQLSSTIDGRVTYISSFCLWKNIPQTNYRNIT